MKRSGNPRRFLLVEETAEVQAAIEKAERASSAEIKVVLLRNCWLDLRRRAHKLFLKFNLDKTAARNCVLIVLVTTNRQFLIYGDEGIHRKVGQSFWNDVRDAMATHFKNEAFGKGLGAGVERIGEKLAAHFPCQPGDKNEISNTIEYSG